MKFLSLLDLRLFVSRRSASILLSRLLFYFTSLFSSFLHSHSQSQVVRPISHLPSSHLPIFPSSHLPIFPSPIPHLPFLISSPIPTPFPCRRPPLMQMEGF